MNALHAHLYLTEPVHTGFPAAGCTQDCTQLH